jgi:hypothetical protein
MKKNSGSPKKEQKRRYKKKQSKKRKRSLKRRLAKLAKLQQVLAATQSEKPFSEDTPAADKPLPPPSQGRSPWDVTITSINNPQYFALQQPQLPPKSSDWGAIQLPGSATPLTVGSALYHLPARLQLQPSSCVLVLLSTTPCDPPTKHPSQRQQRLSTLCDPSLAVVISRLPPPRATEHAPPQQSLPHNWPPLSLLHPPSRPLSAAKTFKALTLAVIAVPAGSGKQVPDSDRKDHRSYEAVFIKYLQEIDEFSPPTKSFRKKNYFFGKASRPNKKRFSRKSTGSLKKKRFGLSDSRQPRRYATKIPRLSRAAGKSSLTKRVKLLAPEIKQHSEFVTSVSAAELLMRQQSNLRCSPYEAPLKPDNITIAASRLPQPQQPLPHNGPPLSLSDPPSRPVSAPATLKELTPAVIAGNANGEEQIPDGDEVDIEIYKPIFRRRCCYFREIDEFFQPTKPFRKKAYFSRKVYRPDIRRSSPKSIGSLKKRYSALSDSQQPRRNATKTPRLSRMTRKALLTKRVNFLIPITEQQSDIFITVSATELLTRRPPSVSGTLKELKLAVIAGNTTRGEEDLISDVTKKSANYKIGVRKYFQKIIKSSRTTQHFRKTSGFFKKCNQLHKRRVLLKNTSTLKKQWPSSTAYRKFRCYASKKTRLSRAAGKTLLTKRVKLLAPEIKQRSELVTTVSVAELLMRQQSSCLGIPHVTVPLKPEKLADNATETKQLPFDDKEDWESSYKPVSRIHYCIHNELSHTTLTDLNPSDSSDTDSDHFTQVSPAAGAMKQELSVACSSVEKPAKPVYPAALAAHLPNAERIFSVRAAKYCFRTYYGLTKTTPGPEWEFREAEKLYRRITKNLPEIKQHCLDEFGCVPETFLCELSTLAAQYEQPGLTRQEEVLKDMLHHLPEHLADFNQLVQSLATSGTRAPGALDSPAAPPGEMVIPLLLAPYLERDNSLNNNY